jgi:uncharacterized membrane protein YuzA (DUF378 family)
MSITEQFDNPKAKHRVVYGVMGLAGVVFVSTLVLPVSERTAQFIATLSFGLMSGLWLAHLVYSV